MLEQEATTRKERISHSSNSDGTSQSEGNKDRHIYTVEHNTIMYKHVSLK
jgi:hypothetical protein